MSFKRLLTATCIVGACIAPAAVSASAQSPNEETALTECLKNPDSSLSVLFLVDTSQSLETTDPGPDPARVKALQSALRALDQIAQTRDVYVDFAEFGSKAARSFPEIDWAPLDPGTNAFADEVAAYADRHDAEDTDYADALGFALERSAQAPGSCQLVAWFSDGMLDIDYQGTPKNLEWANPPMLIDSNDDEPEAEAAATDLICAPNGLNDELRGSGTYLAAIGFNPKPNQFGLLERIAQGDCGIEPPRGTFIEAGNEADLINGLVRSVDPAETDSGVEVAATADKACAEQIASDRPGSFRVPGNVNSMRVRIDRGNAQIKPVLIAPRGSGDPLATTDPIERISLNDTPPRELADGAMLDVTQFSNTLSSFELTFPPQIGAWNGQWEIRLCTDLQDLVGTEGFVEVVNVAGGAGMTLQSADPTIRMGISNELVGQLTSTSGSPRGEDALGSTGSVQAQLGDLDVTSSDVAVDGTVRFEVTVPEDYQDDSADLIVNIQPFAEVLPAGKLWQLEPFAGSLGQITVKPAPTFPIVEPPGSFAEINQQSRSSIATIEAKSSGTDTAGTVQLISVEVDPPDGFPDEPQVRVLDASGKEVNSGGTVAALADGENSTFTVEVSTTEEQSRISTKIRGTITLLSTSSASPGTTETFTYDFNVRIDPIIITENPDSEVLIGFVLLAILLPLALLYLYNILWGARLDFVPTPLVTLGIVTTAGLTTRRDGDGGSSLVVHEADVKALAIEDGRYKRLEMRAADGSLVVFTAHTSPAPWGSPTAATRVGELPVQYGQRGTTRNRRRGRTGLNMTGAWAVALSNPDQDGRRTGNIAILPGRGNEVAQAQRILDEAAEVLLKAYDDGQLPEPEPPGPSVESVNEENATAAEAPAPSATLDDDLPY